MPNWSMNVVSIDGDAKEIAAVKKFLKKGKNPFSLDKIIPMPKVLDVGNCRNEDDACEMAFKFAVQNKKPLSALAVVTIAQYVRHFSTDYSSPVDEQAEAYYNALNKTGYTSWYDWRNQHWGTKWDTCDAVLCEEASVGGDDQYRLVYQFDTAWCAPVPALEALAAKFPNLSIIDKVTNEGEYKTYTLSFDAEQGMETTDVEEFSEEDA